MGDATYTALTTQRGGRADLPGVRRRQTGLEPVGAEVERATDNTTVVTEVLVGLRDRGPDVTRPIVVVIDGAKAPRRAVTSHRPRRMPPDHPPDRRQVPRPAGQPPYRW